ncbi:hypothetical protein CCNA_03925 [Caulobacter vibrioides NA1000]|uniref:Uncharacterized protein n=1 Tax=Caulobacter vibrioides (strain NA1000 / CB15N) TaxID=565050 RepID=A0A0H3IWB4_CAUVN|nr:hypothetical protein [Caulobacter vibrioides]YP_009020497.1 hypothetical protein CCNA_03925 [Caulobacter vibrioides NA1000]AHI88528.1 hypothetical protein CCNA_03925 [Caulobacter vibrioides NA1000]
MSLIVDSKARPPAEMRSDAWRTVGDSAGSAWICSAKPMTLVRGVRNSCVILARKADLARTAASARTRAAIRLSSNECRSVISRKVEVRATGTPSASRSSHPLPSIQR